MIEQSPWALTQFSAFGEKGTLGQKKGYIQGDFYVDDPTEAEQQVQAFYC